MQLPPAAGRRNPYPANTPRPQTPEPGHASRGALPACGTAANLIFGFTTLPRMLRSALPRRSRLASCAAIGYLAITLLPHGLPGQSHRTLADSLTNREFWDLFTTSSEESGVFPSENFVSNEKT